jgi:hypothetical protein
MAWSTAICPSCCTVPQVAQNASQVLENNRNLSQYAYVSTIQAVRPNKPYQYKSQTERLQTLMGKLSNPQAVALRSNGGVPCPTCTGPSVSDLIFTGLDYSDPNWIITFSWTVPAGSSYTYSFASNQPDAVFLQTGDTTATLTTAWPTSPTDITVTVTATTACGSTNTSNSTAPCFLAGSLVTLFDGTRQPIENIQVGDYVLGAFGEYNEVLALHRPLLGDTLMYKINGEHDTTIHHPHVSIDKKFYCGDPSRVQSLTYGREHEVITKNGMKEIRMLHGLHAERVQKLELGVILKGVFDGRPVESIELYSMPPETQLYNLVVDGSHTYYVDGYAVTGWPREDDFDYDAWAPRT